MAKKQGSETIKLWEALFFVAVLSILTVVILLEMYTDQRFIIAILATLLGPAIPLAVFVCDSIRSRYLRRQR